MLHFIHKPAIFPLFYKAERHTIDGERYYRVDNKDSHLSVTSLLGRGDTFPEGLEHRKRAAAARGTLFHNTVERCLRNEEVGKLPRLVASLFSIANPHLHHITEIFAIERPLYSCIMDLAGTADVIGNWDDKLSIIDFKTAEIPKMQSEIRKYFLQTTFYALMLEELYGVLPKQIVIFMVSDELDDPLIYVRDPREFIEECKALAKG